MKNEDFEIELSFELDEPDDDYHILEKAKAKLGLSFSDMPALRIKKRSIDARHGRVRLFITVGSFDEEGQINNPIRDVQGEPIIIIGSGPAGLFCAYELARHKKASIVIERGKKVQARRKDLKGLNQHGLVNEDSNYCFGEGGAGTYSDGKLYTRSHKRGDVRDILEILASHQAPKDILVEGRPHIGSNKLPKVITAIREELEEHGVVFKFDARVTSILKEGDGACGVRLANGEEVRGQAVVVASGHSARDIYEVMDQAGALLEAKPFAMGVRIEHPQALINHIQYGRFAGHEKLRSAYYRLAHTPNNGSGVFSFCMCPGGFIVPASTTLGETVVNGMSLSRRDSPFANSGLVVSISVADVLKAGFKGPLAGIDMQRLLEAEAFRAGGGGLCAPAGRATDFLKKRISTNLPKTSYQPGLRSADLYEVLGASRLPLAEKIGEALKVFDKKMPGYLSEDAVLVGVESRTSSPVRMMRDAETLCSPQIKNLYPCGEGAGFAGGIVSAAIDGMRVAAAILKH